MNKNIYLLLITLMLVFSCAMQNEYDYVITDVNLIDGSGSSLKPGKYIYIKDGIVSHIDSILISKDISQIDGNDKYLIPGLFDAHTHPDPYLENFPRFIHYGVTSILVTGGSRCDDEHYAKMRKIGQQDTFPAPRVFHTSQHFTMEGRHPVKTYASSNWVDGKTVFFLKDTSQIKTLVEKVAKNLIVGIKVTIEDGPTFPFVKRIPQEFISKVVKEGRQHGLEVFAHVSDNTELEMAVKAGVQNLVHYTGVNINIEDQKHMKLIEQLKSRNASWITTLMLDKSFLYPLYPDWFENENMLPEYRLMKEELTQSLIERATRYVDILKIEYGLQQNDLSSFIIPQVEDIRFLLENGINMVLGTDVGNRYIFPGYSLHEELQLMEMGGIDPLTIIQMATLNAAKMLKVSDKLGSIEVGKKADIILLDQNPLETINNALSINLVIKNGKIQKRL